MDEDSSLTNPGYKKSAITLYLWWALNIGIVIFVFLAFLMSTLSYAHSKDLANQVNNSFYTQQGGLIEKTYKVAPAFDIKKGSVVSFCGGDNLQLCEGLGPVWSRPFLAKDSWSPAVSAEFAQLSLYTSIYFHVVDADHNTLRATYIDSSDARPPSVNVTATLTRDSPVTSIHARPTSTANVGVVMYTTHNQTFLQTVTVNPQNGGVAFSSAYVTLFDTHDPLHNGTLHRNIAIVESWILITYAYEGEGANYEVYTVDTTQAATLLRKLNFVKGTFGIMATETIATDYLGNGYIMQANANSVSLGKVDLTGLTITAAGSIDLDVYFNFLQIYSYHNNSVLFVGTQTAWVDEPRTLTLFVEWYTAAPFLRSHVPTNLLANQFHTIQNFQVSLCYLPSNPQEPYGGIFFAYVDGQSDRAKIVRARPVWSNENLHLLPSPSLDISSHRYDRFHNGPGIVWKAAPHVTCPIGTGSNHVLVTLQDFTSSFNTFTWAGGYRYAGIAEEGAAEGKDLDVIRAGISQAHERLVPGFAYYLFNNGSLAPFTSYHELFTSTGFPLPVGTALTDKQLHIEPEAFDRLGSF